LTNFSGDKKLWPIYVSIGNIKSDIRNKPSAHAWIPFALLPIGPKRRSKVGNQPLVQQELDSLTVTHDTLRTILRPLSDAFSSDGYLFHCADEKIRLCVPILCSWLGDHMENAHIHAVQANRCMICTAPSNQLEDLRKQGFSKRNHIEYQRAVTDGDRQRLDSDGVKMVENALWSLPHVIPCDLVRPDLLHNIYLGLLPDLIEWSVQFLEYHKRLPAFDSIWCNLPPYPGFVQTTKAFRSVTQWQGKEMRNFGKVFLATFAASLRRRTDCERTEGGEHRTFGQAIRCVRYFTDFHLLCQYRQHTDETIEYTVRQLERFHAEKEVFLRFRAGKKAKGLARMEKANLASEQRRQSALDLITSAQIRKLREADREEREALEEEILTGNSHFNFPKIHMLSHYTEQISRFGTLQQYSTEICESSHKGLKDAYRRSNRINATPQIIQTYTRQHTLSVRESNLRMWSKTLDVGKDVRDALDIRQNDSNQVGGPKLRLCGGQMQRRFQRLEEVAQSNHLPDLVELTCEYLATYRANPLPDGRSISIACVEVFHSLRIDVPTFQSTEYCTHVARATGIKKFRDREPRSDWVWVRRRNPYDDEPEGGLRGRIPARLNMILKLRIQNLGAESVFKLCHCTLTESVSGNYPTQEEGMITLQWKRCQGNVVVDMSRIEGVAHLVPIEPEGRWLHNNRIDLKAWNEIYDHMY